jgi:hypothetical protein
MAPAEVHARFISLDTTLSINLLPTLLGSVVSQVTRPTRNRRPNLNDDDLSNEDKVLLKAMMKSLLEKKDGVELHDISLVLDKSVDLETRTHLTDLFKAYAESKTHKEVNIQSGMAKRYEFDNPGANLRDKLMKSARYKAQLKKIVEDDQKKRLPMITGVLTCKDIEVSWKNNADIGGGLDATLPVAQQLGEVELTTASQRNPRVKIDLKKTNREEVFARIEDEVIFAIAYDYIKIQTCKASESSNFLMRLLSKLAFWRRVKDDDFYIKSARLGKEARGKGVNVTLGAKGTNASDQIDLEKGDETPDSGSQKGSPLQYEVAYYETPYEIVEEEPSPKKPEEA